MRKLFKNPLEVKETDSLGTTVLKSLSTNYIKGTLAAGAGLGILGLVGWTISKKVEDEKEEEEETELTEEEVEDIDAKSIIEEEIKGYQYVDKEVIDVFNK